MALFPYTYLKVVSDKLSPKRFENFLDRDTQYTTIKVSEEELSIIKEELIEHDRIIVERMRDYYPKDKKYRNYKSLSMCGPNLWKFNGFIDVKVLKKIYILERNKKIDEIL